MSYHSDEIKRMARAIAAFDIPAYQDEAIFNEDWEMIQKRYKRNNGHNNDYIGMAYAALYATESYREKQKTSRTY